MASDPLASPAPGIALGELAAAIGAELRGGDPDLRVGAIAALQDAVPGTVSFLAFDGYRRFLAATRASAVILAPADAAACPVATLAVANPHVAYARAAALLHPPPAVAAGIHPSAVVAPGCRLGAGVAIAALAVVEEGVELGDGVMIGPGCVVGAGSTIGAGSRLAANVTLGHGVVVGQRVLIHPGAVIGADGFGLADDGGVWLKVPQLGTVRIGDDVEIGANTTVDRGALEDTILEEGVKLDNQIQVAHNCVIGAHTAVAGCAGIAGSTRIGRHCRIGGAAMITGHLSIADGVTLLAGAMVTKDIDTPGVYSSAIPAEPRSLWNRTLARLRRLDELARRVKRLERQA